MAGNYLKLYINIYYLETFIRKTSRCGNFKSKVGNDVGSIITFLNIKKRIMLLKPACKIILQLQLKYVMHIYLLIQILIHRDFYAIAQKQSLKYHIMIFFDLLKLTTFSIQFC